MVFGKLTRVLDTKNWRTVSQKSIYSVGGIECPRSLRGVACSQYRARGATLCHDLHRVGYIVVDAEPDESSMTGVSNLAPANPLQATGFDIAISAESSKPFSEPSMLIQHAARKLRPDGIFILSMPYRVIGRIY